ncbi:MAG TPA: hypothetical protein VNJ07_11055 [Chitinophagales bacterium]|nr:hypothetical protein [Chitinophagales bacterium]
MKNETPVTLTSDLRKTLKAMMQKEIEKLPEYLETIEPKERLNILCKLIPFVLPKVEAVSPDSGEPGVWE